MAQYLRQQSLEDRVAELERQVEALARTNSIGSTTLTNGNLILRQGGSILVMSAQDPNRVIARIGDLHNPDSAGVPQMGFQLFRDTPANELAMALWQPNGASTSGFPNQFYAVYDQMGNYVFTTDTLSKKGIAMPFRAIGASATSFESAPYTQGTGWGEVAGAQVPADAPRLQVSMSLVGDQVAGVNTGGNYRIMVGGVTAASGTVPATFTWTAVAHLIDMTPYYAPGSTVYVSVQVQQTAGATTGGRNNAGGSIIAAVQGLYQRGS